MRVKVCVKPRAKRRLVEVMPDGSLVVQVTEPAQDGKANAAVIQLLAELFRVPRHAVTIRRGLTSRRKLVEILRPNQ